MSTPQSRFSNQKYFRSILANYHLPLAIDRINITSGSPFEDSIGFARAVKAADHIYITVTAPIAQLGVINAEYGDAYEQTKTGLKIIQKAVEDAGGQWQNVASTRSYLRKAADWKAATKAHHEFFTEIHPACTFLDVKGFIDPSWLVETVADCIL